MAKSQEKNYLSGLGSRLKSVRNKWKLSQKGMSQKINVALTSYQMYERGERDISSTVVYRMALLGISPLWLICNKGPMDIERLESQNLIRLDNNPLSSMVFFLKDFWDQANDKERAWLEIQFERCFPEFRFSIKKHQPKKEGTNDTDVA